jgi:hypothetical protein
MCHSAATARSGTPPERTGQHKSAATKAG